jgi:hypothetical protein
MSARHVLQALIAVVFVTLIFAGQLPASVPAPNLRRVQQTRDTSLNRALLRRARAQARLG